MFEYIIGNKSNRSKNAIVNTVKYKAHQFNIVSML